jgi:hypothetical protein
MRFTKMIFVSMTMVDTILIVLSLSYFSLTLMDPNYILYWNGFVYYYGKSLNSWIYFTTALTTSPKMDTFDSSDGKRDDGSKKSLPVGPFEKGIAYLFPYETLMAGKCSS